MSVDHAFRISSILLAASAFLGLVLTGRLPVWLSLLGVLALAMGSAPAFGWNTGRLHLRLSRQAWNALLLVAFGGFVIDFLWISGDLLPAGTNFLVVLMVNKLLNLDQRKDFLQLYAITLLALLAAAALTIELWFAAVFALYLLAAIWTLLLFHLRDEARERTTGQPVETQAPGWITPKFFWATNGIAIVAFGITLTIFFLIPRIGAGFFHKTRGELVRTTGFSDQVDLGVIGTIKLDESVVMRVEFPGRDEPPKGPLYFRGAAYDRYNGQSWSNSFPHRRLVNRAADGSFRVADLATVEPPPVAITQEFLVEALDTTALFGLSFVSSVRGNFLIVQQDRMGALHLPYAPATRFQYTVVSSPRPLLHEDETSERLPYPREIREVFLQLPELDQRIRTLARDITVGPVTPHDQVLAVEDYLRSNFEYRLDLESAILTHPLEEFLFSRKAGYCEHYATAMVVLLRTLGIPARLVTGFLPGEWNDVGNYFTVRQRDAHAWVEVYFPRSGWVTYDPTPAVAPEPIIPLVTRLGRLMDSLRLKWDRFVIKYSLRDQMAVAQEIRERTVQVRSQASMFLVQARRWLGEAQEWLFGQITNLGWLVWVTLAGLLAFGLWLGAGRLRLILLAFQASSKAFTSRQTAVVKIYSRMLRVLASRGFQKPPGATPWEFARHVSGKWKEGGRYVTPLTDLYYQVRFGQAPLRDEDLDQAQTWLSHLRAKKP